jgi:hypothetical protein
MSDMPAKKYERTDMSIDRSIAQLTIIIKCIFEKMTD